MDGAAPQSVLTKKDSIAKNNYVYLVVTQCTTNSRYNN